MKLYALSSLLFLTAIGLTSCMTRDIAVPQQADTNVSSVIVPGDSMNVGETAIKHKKKSKKAGKVHYFSDFVKKHKSADKAFAKVIARPQVIIDFYADWCGPCKALGKFLTTVAPQYMDVLIVKINIEEFPTIAEQFGIRSLPTMLFFKNGTLIEKIKGFEQRSLINSIKNIFN